MLCFWPNSQPRVTFKSKKWIELKLVTLIPRVMRHEGNDDQISRKTRNQGIRATYDLNPINKNRSNLTSEKGQRGWNVHLQRDLLLRVGFELLRWGRKSVEKFRNDFELTRWATFHNLTTFVAASNGYGQCDQTVFSKSSPKLKIGAQNFTKKHALLLAVSGLGSYLWVKIHGLSDTWLAKKKKIFDSLKKFNFPQFMLMTFSIFRQF